MTLPKRKKQEERRQLALYVNKAHLDALIKADVNVSEIIRRALAEAYAELLRGDD